MKTVHSESRSGLASSILPRAFANAIAVTLLPAALICGAPPAAAQYVQQGPKLVGSGAVGNANEGEAVAVSGDGSTIMIGGEYDNNYTGAAWVFVRSNGAWSQQGGKLVGTGATRPAEQGKSVALSSDGTTALVGGPFDNGQVDNYVGATWVFVRSNGVWQQQAKLVGSGVAGTTGADQGFAVALSPDGNTALVGAPSDNDGVGAAWVFTRSNGVWTQQQKLTPSDASPAPAGSQFGWAAAISADGNTAVLGGRSDNDFTGAAWVFTRSSGVWTQQGPKLVGNGAIGAAQQGYSVGISGEADSVLIGASGDNNGAGATWVFVHSNGVWIQQQKLLGLDGTAAGAEGFAAALPFSDTGPALVGGPGDNNGLGAAWLFTRSNGVWGQQGAKLVGTGAAGAADQGSAVALSQLPARIAVVGAYSDNNSVGAAWVFAEHGAVASHDFDGDARSDILWRDSSGNVAAWLMNGASVTQSAGIGNANPAVWSIAGQRDFDADTDSDILWRDNSGDVAIWFMHGTTVASSVGVGAAPTSWTIAGTGDYNGDGSGDILWRDTGGNVALWMMNGASVVQSCGVGNAPTSWSIVGTGDFDGDGKTDILWRDTSGNIAIWFMNGCTVAQSAGVGNAPTTWSVAGTGDFDGNGKADILWHDTSGNVAVWLMNGAAVAQSSGVGNAPTTWSIAATGDFGGGGTSDILWHDSSGNVAIWFMFHTSVSQSSGVGNAPPIWSVQGSAAD